MKINKRTILFIGILVGGVANMMMQTVVATILPQVSQGLGDSHLYGWVFSGYLLMSTITIPLFSKLADLYGYKLFYVIGMILFLIGTILCGLAPSLGFLVIARLIQGIGAGALGPVSIAFISTLFPAEDRGKALSAFAAIQLFANLLGPILGGYIAIKYSWSYAFYMVIPFGVISLMIISFSKINSKKQKAYSLKEMDYVGALLLGMAIALFIQAWALFETYSWNVIVLSMLGGSVASFLLFLLQEKRHSYPIFPQSFSKIRNITLANLSAFLIGILNYGAIVIFPLFSLVIFGESPSKSAQLLLPLMIGLSVGIIYSGRTIQKVSYRKLAQRGWIILTLSFAITSILCFVQVGVILIFVTAFATGLGIGVVMPTFLVPAQNAVSDDNQATVGGMIQLTRNIGGAVGIPILTSIINISNGRLSGTFQYGVLFSVLCLIGLVGLFIGGKFKGDAVKIRNN